MNRKNTTKFVLIMLLALFVSINTVSAEDSIKATISSDTSVISSQNTEATASATDKEDLNKDTIKTKIEEKRIQLQKEVDQKRLSKLKEHSNRNLERLSSMLSKMDILEKRLENRISKIEKKRGTTLSEERKLADEAKNKISKAREDISKAKTEIDELLKNTNVKESLSKIKEIVRSVDKSVKEAHKSLVNAIRSVNASTKENSTASSTNSN